MTRWTRIAWATVPAILLAGILSGWLSGSGNDNPWFDGLAKPWFMPPGWAFPVAWTILYALMGLALAMLLAARARGAIAAFLVQFALNLAWSPTFFAGHAIGAALVLILALDLAVIATILLAWRRCRAAALLLLLPYALWLALATALNAAILVSNG